MNDEPDTHLIATCEECGQTWDVDFEPVPCECEDSDWFVRWSYV